MKIATSVTDAFSGLKLAFALSSALYYRRTFGKGQNIEVSMLGASFDLLEQNLIEYSITKNNPQRTGNLDNAISPFGLYKTKDGFISLAVGNEKLWELLKNVLKEYISFDESEYLTNSLRLKNNKKLQKIIESVFNDFSIEKLLNLLHKMDIPCGKVNNMSDLVKNKDLYKKGLIKKINHDELGECVMSVSGIKFSENGEIEIKKAPKIGEDNKECGI